MFVVVFLKHHVFAVHVHRLDIGFFQNRESYGVLDVGQLFEIERHGDRPLSVFFRCEIYLVSHIVFLSQHVSVIEKIKNSVYR